MGIKTVRHPPYSPDLAPFDFWLFPKLRGCRFETIELMKEAVTEVIDMRTQVDFHWAFKKLLERYNECISAGGDYFKVNQSFMCVLSIKVPIWKKSGNLFNDPRIININFIFPSFMSDFSTYQFSYSNHFKKLKNDKKRNYPDFRYLRDLNEMLNWIIYSKQRNKYHRGLTLQDEPTWFIDFQVH